MYWIAVDTFNHLSNHSFFSIITADRRSQLILWYESPFALAQGDTLHIDRKIISINDGVFAINLLNTIPFTRFLWQNIRQHNKPMAGI